MTASGPRTRRRLPHPEWAIGVPAISWWNPEPALRRGGTEATAVVVLMTLLAVVLIPVSIAYYFWLARHVAPRVARLPTRLAIFVLGLWIALPWLVLAAAVWLTRR